jgi:glycosidase
MPLFLPVDGKILNNDFFGGDLRGIINKLSYLKSLNITVIYLNPIFEAASNHKYDTGNFMKIDRMFGNDEDFIELCEKAKLHGIRIIIDGVFNHTGDDSIYFNKYNHYPTVGAYNDKNSEFYDWYLFIKHPNEYMSWWGIHTLPSVNQTSKSYLKYIDGVLKRYLRLGASGYRLDVVDELMNEFVERINKVVKNENPENIIIGEVWEDASNKVAYSVRKQYFNGKQLDSVMNYVFKEAIISYLKHNNVLGIRNVVRSIINNYPKEILDSLMNILDTHDTMRIINNFATNENLTKIEAANYRLEGSEYKRALMKMKMATILQYTLPGVPSIYYGDEAGLQGFDDPFCRQTFPWDNISADLYEWYKKLGEIRKEEVFINGDYEEVMAKDNIFAFKRVKYKDEVLVVINNSNNQISMEVNGYDLINKLELRYLSLPAQTGTIIKL